MHDAFREIKKTIQLSPTGNPNFPPHLHEAVEVIYLKRGTGTAYCDGVAYTLHAGDFFLVFPNQIHYYCDFGPESDGMLFTANPAFFPLYTTTLTEKTSLTACYTTGREDETLLQLYRLVFEEHARGASNEVILSLLSTVLGMLLERCTLTAVNNNQSCALRIIQYCKKHYTEELTVDRVSQELHISRSHISHTFSNRLKISFPDYVNSLRLANAVQLLGQNRYSITEVAQRSGFQTIRTFNRAFLKQFGVSPRQYLQQVLPSH
ncbi:MAG: helix-turn-helix transcriptional regulator [Clostridia bacterium]|nr:helix-turn-helix transcriptional regulator [Clostridia bacterium]